MSTELKLAPSIDLLEKAWANHIERESRRTPAEARKYLYASQRRKCLRRSVLESTHPEMLPPFEPDTLARLRRGVDRERDLGIDLERVGRICEPPFSVISQQERIRITDRKGRLVISGKIDGRIQFATGQRWPFEIKSWSPQLVERIETFADLYDNRWLWPGAHQLLSYLYGSNEPDGLLILDRPGLPRLIQVNLEENLQQMEDFLHEAEVCVDHIEAETLPDFVDDPTECRYCGFYGSACNPPSLTDGAQVVVDEAWIQKLERWHETLEAGKDHASLDKAIKKRFRGIDMAIAGGFLLEGKWQPATQYDIPDDEQKRIDEIVDKYARKEPKGKFFLTVTKV